MTAKQRQTPQRSCLVCGVKKDKRNLTRIVRTSSGVQIDPSGKLNGRGAYLCENIECWHRASETNAVNKALRITLTSDDRDRIRQAQPS